MSERTFQVILLDNRQGKSKPLAYPSLHGAASYQLMRRLAIRGFESFAVTKANDIEERLSLADMAMVYGGSK